MSAVRIDPLLLRNARKRRRRRRNAMTSVRYGGMLERYLRHAGGSAAGFAVPMLVSIAAAKLFPPTDVTTQRWPLSVLAQIAAQLAVGPVGAALVMNGPKARKYQAAYMGATFYPGIQALAIMAGVDEAQALLPFPRDQLMGQLGELGEGLPRNVTHILDPWSLRK